MKLIAILSLHCFFLVLQGCQIDDGTRNIEDFYYPLDGLAEAKVYEYRSVGNPNDPPVYWLYRSVKEKESQFLVGYSYGPAFSPDQFVKEERVENGMLLVDFHTYEAGASGEKIPVKATIVAPNVFPFQVKQVAGVLLCSFNWQPVGGGAKISLVRNRQFDSDTTFTFRGKPVPSVKFNTRELVDQEEVGHLELEFGGTEVYAKDIGLVYFRKDIYDGWRMAYQLHEIHSLADFEQKFNTKLEPDKQ